MAGRGQRRGGCGHRSGSIGLFHRVAEGLNALGTLWIIALMLLVNADVAARGLFNHPIAGVPEMIGLSVVGIVFLQLPHTALLGRLTRSTALLSVLARRAPRLRTALEGAYAATGAAVAGIMAHAIWPQFLQAWSRGDHVGNPGNFWAPLWPIRLIMLVGCLGLVAHFLVQAAVAVVAVRQGPAAARREGGRREGGEP